MKEWAWRPVDDRPHGEHAVNDYLSIFHWRNDPETRQNSIISEPVSETAHIVWFIERLRQGRWWMMESVEEGPVGHVRLDHKLIQLDYNNGVPTEVFEVSLTVNPEFRGKGYGTSLIAMATIEGRRELGVFQAQFLARIKPENRASIRSFEKNGYRQLPAKDGELLMYVHGLRIELRSESR